MDHAPMDEKRLAGGRELIGHLMHSGVNLVGAFWAYHTGADEWRLTLVTGAVETAGPKQMLRQTANILKSLNGKAGLDIWDVDFESPYDPRIAVFAKGFHVAGDGSSNIFQDITVDEVTYADLRIYFMDSEAILNGNGVLPPEKIAGFLAGMS